MNQSHRPPILGSGTLIAVVVAVAVLYFAREVLIPFAMAVLLSFLLAPLVIRLRHWRLGKFPAVFIVMTIFASVIALVGWLVTAQLVDLAYKLPQYQQNIHSKLKSVSLPPDGFGQRFSKFFQELGKDIGMQESISTKPGENTSTASTKPVQVEIHEPMYSWKTVGVVVGSLVNPLIQTGIVLVMIIFILLQREDMRDRLIRLIGAGDLNRTTKALDDAARRVSRYLLAQLGLNSGYGIAVGIGLYFMGVPNPILWGVLAATLRFVPYVGIWIAALMPAAVAFAIEPGWTKSILVIALFFGMDLIAFNLLEPLLYGASTGISPLGILLAAVFWTWLWGPIGLLLSTPLTVCVAVMGCYVPAFEFLGVLLNDTRALPPETRFYQRLLAMDVEEATEISEKFLADHSLDELFDELIVPALILAEEDRRLGKLDSTQQKSVFQNIGLLIEDIAERGDEIRDSAMENKDVGRSPGLRRSSPISNLQSQVAIIPAHGQADELCGEMLAGLLRWRGFDAQTFPAGDLLNNYVERAACLHPEVVCVSSLPSGAFLHARHVCKRLHVQLPQVKVILGVWHETEQERQNRISSVLGCTVVMSLRAALEQIIPLLPTVSAEAKDPALRRKREAA